MNLMKRVSFKNLGLMQHPTVAAPPVAMPASHKEELVNSIKTALAGLDASGSAVQRRKRAAKLAAVLNDVKGEAATLVLEQLHRDKAAARLVHSLDAALDKADSTDDSSDDDNLPDPDLVLARWLLSCLA